MTRRRSSLTLAFVVPAALFSFSLSAQTNSRPSAPATSTALPSYGEKLHIPGIPNAGKIDDHLYRGAQPKQSGLLQLKALGITTIVDLRGEDREKADWERSQANVLGMRFVHIPVSGWSPPKDGQVAQFLALFRSDPAPKIFVHCRFGDDRTGVFVATYRMALENWPSDRALREMYFFGFNGFWHPSMKSFIRDFPAALHSSPALAGFRSSNSPATLAHFN